MKRQLICFISLLILSNECFAQQTDPTLTAAVGAQSAMLNSLFSKREKTQKKIIAAETAVTVAMDRMHKVEDQMSEGYGYRHTGFGRTDGCSYADG